MATLAQNIQRAIDDFNTIENAIVQKGVPVPDGTPTSEYGEKILSIETGVDTSGDTIVPSAMREGYTAHNAAGQEITGAIPNYDGGSSVEITSPEGATLNTAGTYCEGNIEVVPKLQEKTATTGEVVTADEGYAGLKSVDTTPVYKAAIEAVRDRIQGENGSRYYYPFFYWASYPYDLIPPKYTVKFGGAWSGRQAFAWNLLIKEISVDIIMAGTDIGGACFEGSKYLHTIKKITLESGTIISNWFDYCTSLVNLTIEGTIGQNGFNVSWSPLSKASLISVINALSDTTTGLTVTLRLAAVNTAFETTAGAADGSTSDEWTALIATKPNWTINLINS